MILMGTVQEVSEMSRYIDAEALKEEFTCKGDEWINNIIDNEPTIDIVRCKECRHNYSKALNHGKMQPRCDFTDRKLSENDYCSRGEREGE